MRVSMSFKNHVEVMHSEILNVSLGLCSKKHWANKVIPLYKDLLYSLDFFSSSFEMDDVLILMSEGSLFRSFLHFFLCKRLCDNVKDYCTLCSHVRPRNFQSLTLFDSVYLETRDFKSQLGIDNKTVDFQVFFQNYMVKNNSITDFCLREAIIDHPSDIFVMFVSIFIRVNLNLCYNFFLKNQLPITTEKYFVRKIEEFVRDLACEIWHLNVNYFYLIFQNFEILNRSICFYTPNVNLIDDIYKQKVEPYNYFSKLPVVSVEESDSSSNSSNSSDTE